MKNDHMTATMTTDVMKMTFKTEKTKYGVYFYGIENWYDKEALRLKFILRIAWI